jgi:DNA repair protein SbcC/Rad50
MKLHHSADHHNRKEYFAEIMASMDVIEETGRKEHVDLFAIAGDIWHGPILDTKGSRFAEFVDRIRRLADVAPVVMIYGTPSHDTEGSLDVFEQLQSTHGITVLRQGIAYFLQGGKIISGDAVNGKFAEALIFSILEPNKKWLLAKADGAMGKVAADDQIRDAMRSLFLGLAAKRKEYPNLPCILLYHGQVAGARTGTGQEIAGGLAVTREDLALVGADYIALGDIHEPQQIPGIPAYYPGSIVPQGWGETHKAGCNLVEIDGDANGWARAVTRVEFPHPRNRHEKVAAKRNPGELLGGYLAGLPAPIELNGERCWLEITGPRDILVGLDIDEITQRLFDSGFLPGSKVTTLPDPEETVRVAGISEKKRERDKVVIWAENTGLTAPETALVKVDELEREFASAVGGVRARRWRINSLRLRGAKGIWKGQRKDEVFLDFDALGPGVHVLIGQNGKGKTTVLENAHPWSQMLTRDGKLRDHFRLRDSAREIIVTDEISGIKYKFLISMNAAAASGGSEYNVAQYVDGNGSGEPGKWEPLPMINGRLEPYEQAIAELYGSLDLYLRTAFITQGATGNHPELKDASKGQRKELFAELSGVDRHDRYRERAKAQGDAIDGEISQLQAQIDAAADVEASIKDLEKKIEDSGAEETRKRDEFVKAGEQAKVLEKECDDLEDQAADLVKKRERKIAAEGEQEAEKEGRAADEEKIAEYRKAAAEKPKADADLARIRELEAEASGLKDQEAKLAKAFEEKVKAYNTEVGEQRPKRDASQHQVDQAQKDLSATEKTIAVIESQLKDPLADKCPTCGQELPASKLFELKANRLKNEDHYKVFLNLKKTAEDNLAAARDELAALVPPALPVRDPFPGAARLQDISRELSFLDRKALEATVSRAIEADVQIRQLEKNIAASEKWAEELKDEIARLAKDLEGLPAIAEKLKDVTSRQKTAAEAVTTTFAAAEAAKATAEEARRNLTAAEERRAKRDQAVADIGTKQLELADWRFLERAEGPDGIPALELDELAPGIAEVANRLLAEAFGTRKRIEFRTTRTGGTGSRKKQIETFEIWILDGETGEEQEIATLSGGEYVWFKRALYDAFAVIRARNTGIQFLTVFQDETDGALDPEARQQYLRMLEAAHRESGRFQTILISHSSEIQQMVEQTIDVTALPSGKEVVDVKTGPGKAESIDNLKRVS